jgi:hypothetical protein
LKLVYQKKRGCLEAGVFPEGTRKKKVIPMVSRRAYRRVSVNEIDHFERPWKIVSPKETGVLVELCELLKSHCPGFSIGLESTGTYGDVVRQALSKAGISVAACQWQSGVGLP